jgi:protein-disulfide isomerase
MPYLAFAVIVACACQGHLHAQATSPERSSDPLVALTETVRELTREIAELSALLRSALPPSPIENIPLLELPINGAAIEGSNKARIVVVEFSDFQCPFCGKNAQANYPELRRQFIDSGKIRYVFRHLPLEELHPLAFKAAEAAECAGSQGKFWEMHDQLFANQNALAPADLINDGLAIGLNQSDFAVCLTRSRMADKVRSDLDAAQRLGLTGTPAFLLGEMDEGGALVKVTKRIFGAQAFPVFQTAIGQLLAIP